MSMNEEAVAAVAALAERGMGSEVLDRGKVYAFCTGDGRVQVVDLVHGEWADAPERRQGTTVVDDVGSLAWLYGRFAVPPTTEVYAERDGARVTVVVNGHDADADYVAGWRDHRLVLQLRLTDGWCQWLQASGVMFEQRQFAEFVEDHLADVREPSAAFLLEVAQTLQGSQKVSWQSAHVLKDGTRQLSYVESTEAVAGGPGGQMKIPGEIKLALKVFEGSADSYEITGRFRYQINGGRLTLGIKLLGMAETHEAAFGGVVAQVGEATGAAVLWGRP